MEQLGETVHAIVRQSDLAIKYTSWALAIVLPDTPLSGAKRFAEKLKAALSGLRPPWDSGPLTMSVAIAEAIVSQDYDNEDIVTDLINRVESGLEEARKRGGNEIVSLELAKN
jgi:GGDEF domain-containing protein